MDKMQIGDIFNQGIISRIEHEILFQAQLHEKNNYREEERRVIQSLIGIRKDALDEHFVLDEDYCRLISDFNETLKASLIEMRKKTIAAYKSIKALGYENINATGKCFLSYEYSNLHPIQTDRAKQIWSILNGTIDDYMPLYSDGACKYCCSNDDFSSELDMLGNDFNWNEHLDPVLTKNMHLIYPFHDLWEHKEFAIYDLLWIREFNIEINVEIIENLKATCLKL